MATAPVLRPMGLLEIVDQTFRLYRSNFGLFFGIAAVPYIPLYLAVANMTPGPRGQIGAGFIIGLVSVFLILPIAGLASAALTKAVSDRYMGEDATLAKSYVFVAKRIVPMLLTGIIAGIFVMAGFFLLVIPGIVFAFWVAFLVEVMVIEGWFYVNAIKRGKFLVGEGVWAEVLVLGIITWVLSMLISAAIGAVMGLWLTVLGPDSMAGRLVSGLFQGVAQAVTMPIGLVAGILLYYDSRIRKEGFDLEVLAKEMGRTLPTAPPAEGGPVQPGGGYQAAAATGYSAPPADPTLGAGTPTASAGVPTVDGGMPALGGTTPSAPPVAPFSPPAPAPAAGPAAIIGLLIVARTELAEASALARQVLGQQQGQGHAVDRGRFAAKVFAAGDQVDDRAYADGLLRSNFPGAELGPDHVRAFSFRAPDGNQGHYYLVFDRPVA